MQSGRLKHFVTIQRRSETQDAIGQPVVAWVQVAQVFADIRHQSGLEAVRADAPVSTVKASVRIRYRTGIDAGMRVLHRGVVYNITAVLPDEVGRQHVDLACEVVR